MKKKKKTIWDACSFLVIVQNDSMRWTFICVGHLISVAIGGVGPPSPRLVYNQSTTAFLCRIPIAPSRPTVSSRARSRFFFSIIILSRITITFSFGFHGIRVFWFFFPPPSANTGQYNVISVYTSQYEVRSIWRRVGFY